MRIHCAPGGSPEQVAARAPMHMPGRSGSVPVSQ